MKNISLFVTGIDTNVGKTVVSSILVNLFYADYFKPIQSGNIDESDSSIVRKFINNSDSIIHKEKFLLQKSCSPHEASSLENIYIKLSDIKLPFIKKNKCIIVEGAGGIYTPINNKNYIIDVIIKLKLSVALVIKDYIGCINHSIMTINSLLHNNIPIHLIVFNGKFNNYSKKAIIDYIKFNVFILEVPYIYPLTNINIKEIILNLKDNIYEINP